MTAETALIWMLTTGFPITISLVIVVEWRILCWWHHRIPDYHLWRNWQKIRRAFRRPPNVGSAVNPQRSLSTRAGVEPTRTGAPPAHPRLVPAASSVPAAAGTKPQAILHTQSPVGAADPHVAASTGLEPPPSP